MSTVKQMTLDEIRDEFSNGEQVVENLLASPSETLLAPMDAENPSSTRHVLVRNSNGMVSAIHYSYWDYPASTWESLGLEMLYVINQAGELADYPDLQAKAEWGERVWRQAVREEDFVDDETGLNVVFLDAGCSDAKDLVIVGSEDFITAVLTRLAGIEIFEAIKEPELA